MVNNTFMVKPTVLPLLARRLDPAFNNSRSSPISLATVRRNTADAAMQAAKEVAAAAAVLQAGTDREHFAPMEKCTLSKKM